MAPNQIILGVRFPDEAEVVRRMLKPLPPDPASPRFGDIEDRASILTTFLVQLRISSIESGFSFDQKDRANPAPLNPLRPADRKHRNIILYGLLTGHRFE
jgi:hypothetical protein